MEDGKYPKQFLDYQPIRRQRTGLLLEEAARQIQSWGENRSLIGLSWSVRRCAEEGISMHVNIILNLWIY